MRESLLHLSHPASAQSRLAVLLRDDRPEELLLTAFERAVLATNLLPARRGRIPAFLLELIQADLTGKAFAPQVLPDMHSFCPGKPKGVGILQFKLCSSSVSSKQSEYKHLMASDRKAQGQHDS